MSTSFQPWDNPMGTAGFEFIEYTAPDPVALGKVFETLGFKAIARHRNKNVTLYRQGGINFLINAEPDSFGQRFARLHGPSICARSEEHTSELQSLMRISYAVFCLKKKNTTMT